MNPPNKQLERKMLTELRILCNACGIPLLSNAEAKIGVHISCVQEANLKKKLRIPSPRYGVSRAQPESIPSESSKFPIR